MGKFIALEKLNSLLANIKADRAIKQYCDRNPELINPDNVENKVHLVQLILRIDAFKRNSGIPFYAFIKKAGSLFAVVDLETGSALLADSSVIASETDVKSNFRINGVTYGLMDEVNGNKRYRPLSYEPKKPRQRLTPHSKEVLSAIELDKL